MNNRMIRKYIVALGIRRTVRGIGNCDVVFYLETVEAFNMEDAKEEALDMTGGLYDVVFIQRYEPTSPNRKAGEYDQEAIREHILRHKKRGVQWPESAKRDGELHEREVSKET